MDINKQGHCKRVSCVVEPEPCVLCPRMTGRFVSVQDMCKVVRGKFNDVKIRFDELAVKIPKDQYYRYDNDSTE